MNSSKAQIWAIFLWLPALLGVVCFGCVLIYLNTLDPRFAIPIFSILISTLVISAVWIITYFYRRFNRKNTAKINILISALAGILASFTAMGFLVENMY